MRPPRDRRLVVVPAGIMAGLLAGLAAPALAETTFEPRLETAGTYVSNVTLAPRGEERHDWVGTLAPGFSLARTGTRLDFALDYDLEALWYAQESDYDDTYNRFLGNARGAIVEDRLFLDLYGLYDQRNVDPGGIQATSNVYVTGNRTNETTWRASPWWRQPLGDGAETVLRYTTGRTEFDYEDAANRLDARASALERFDAFVGSSRREGWTWGADYLYSRVDYDDSPGYRYERAGGELGVPAGSRTHALFAAGVESDVEEDPGAGGLDSPWWNVGVLYAPSVRQSFEARVGNRFYGTSWELRWKRRGSRGELELEYVEQPSTYGALEFAGGGNLPPGWDVGRIDTRVYLSRRAAGRLTWQTAKSDWAFSVYNDRRQYYDDATVIDPRDDETYSGARIAWDWQTFARTGFEFEAFWETNELTGGDNDRGQVLVALVRRLTPRLELRLEGTRLVGNSEIVDDYRSNTGTIALRWSR